MKRTLQQKLERRKYKRANPLLYKILVRLIVNKVIAPPWNIHYDIKDNINDEKGACFIVFNHQSRVDYVWAIQSCYPKRLNFMVGYNEFFRSHLALIMLLAHSIPKRNFTLDISAMRAIDTLVKKKAAICFSPEGMSSITGHNQPVVAHTSKLFKHYKIPVYMVKSKGAFLSNTKVCLDERHGRIDVTLSKLFSVEDIEKYSSEELDAKLDEALWQDDYEWNKEQQITYNSNGNICSHLHDLLYKCPKCHEEFHMHGEGDTLTCTNCGNTLKMDDKYNFIKVNEDSVYIDTPTRWVDEERRDVYKEISTNPDFSFSFDCTLGKLDPYKKIKGKKITSYPCGKGKVTIDHQGFHYRGTKDGQEFNFDLSTNELPTFGMPTDVTYVALYYRSEYYDIIPDKPIVGKLLLIAEELHRFHGGAWKNFPWMDWIYE